MPRTSLRLIFKEACQHLILAGFLSYSAIGPGLSARLWIAMDGPLFGGLFMLADPQLRSCDARVPSNTTTQNHQLIVSRILKRVREASAEPIRSPSQANLPRRLLE